MELSEEEKARLRLPEVSEWASQQPLLDVIEQAFLAGKKTSMASGKTVVISRKWGNPSITIQYLDDGIYLTMLAEDFIKSVIAALPHPIKLWTRDAQSRAVKQATEAVQEEMKAVTVVKPPPIR
jgi:hypothetical protein